MRKETTRTAALILLLAACNGADLSTSEVEAAAVDRARQTLNISDETPLAAEVWTGRKWRDDLVLCGTVSSQAQDSQIRPQRFAAVRNDPLRWLIFEDAHNPLVDTGGDEVPDWVNLCMPRQPA